MAFSDEFGGTLKCAGNEMKIFPAVDIGIVHVITPSRSRNAAFTALLNRGLKVKQNSCEFFQKFEHVQTSAFLNALKFDFTSGFSELGEVAWV